MSISPCVAQTQTAPMGCLNLSHRLVTSALSATICQSGGELCPIVQVDLTKTGSGLDEDFATEDCIRYKRGRIKPYQTALVSAKVGLQSSGLCATFELAWHFAGLPIGIRIPRIVR